MGNYYCLMAGLPELVTQDAEPGLSVADFKEQLEEVLETSDKKLLFYFFLKYDCLNLLKMLKNPDAEIDPRGNFGREQYEDMIRSAREMNFNVHRFPAFMSMFARDYNYNKDKAGYFADDELLHAYYEYAMGCPNRMMREWYTRSFHITNILTALAARKNGWDVADYIKGDNEVNEMIRENNTHDFGLQHEYDYMQALMKIVDIEDPVEKEKRLDALKWEWLEDVTFMDPFNIEAVFAYLLKLDIQDRWQLLDVEKGREVFRGIIDNLRGEAKVPEEFLTPAQRAAAALKD